MRRFACPWALGALAAGALALATTPSSAEETSLEALQRQLEALARQNAALQETVGELRQEVKAARDEARAAEDTAQAAERVAASSGLPAQARRDRPLVSRGLGNVSLQLLDVSLDVLTAGGFSTAEDGVLEQLQGGDHDPRRRGFNLQQVELAFAGAVDPYLTAETHILYWIDPEGESRFEVEEAFAQTLALPFGLEEQGLQLEMGQFFTEFGRANPRHPHQWHWQDQPLVLTRFFGEDGMRNPGLRVGWLLPTPWYSELHLGAQNAQGETMTSFNASDEVFEERPIGGRPFGEPRTRSLADLVYLTRWVNALDLSPEMTAALGFSGVFGPNATGRDGRTVVYGADLKVKWRPLTGDRGWPFVIFQAEILGRHYQADDFFGCPGLEEGDACTDPAFLSDKTLDDWGGYAQLLYGFRRNWAVGFRYEWATGSGSNVAFDEDVGAFVPVSRNSDPFRDSRMRFAPLLVYYPSEFSRLRLQYNIDRAKFFNAGESTGTDHTVWFGLEFLFGSHPAHDF